MSQEDARKKARQKGSVLGAIDIDENSDKSVAEQVQTRHMRVSLLA